MSWSRWSSALRVRWDFPVLTCWICTWDGWCPHACVTEQETGSKDGRGPPRAPFTSGSCAVSVGADVLEQPVVSAWSVWAGHPENVTHHFPSSVLRFLGHCYLLRKRSLGKSKKNLRAANWLLFEKIEALSCQKLLFEEKNNKCLSLFWRWGSEVS
jgi:hypothetical protein